MHIQLPFRALKVALAAMGVGDWLGSVETVRTKAFYKF